MKKLTLSTVFLTAVVCFWALPYIGEAATLNVPADYPKIYQAIDAAEEGDTIFIANGVYVPSSSENPEEGEPHIYLENKSNLTFRGESSEDTILNLSIHVFDSDNIVIENMKFDNIDLSFNYSSEMEVRNSKFVNVVGTGVVALGVSNARITNNHFEVHNGSCSVQKGFEFSGTSGSISGNKLIILGSNNCPNSVGILSNSNTVNEQVIIRNNLITNFGNGIQAEGQLFRGTIVNNTITGLTNTQGKAISTALYYTPLSVSIRNNVVFNNRGRGIVTKLTTDRDQNVTVSYNDVYLNDSGDYQTGRATLANNISEDPLFVDAANGDFHEQNFISPVIDQGDPADPYSLEPNYNGGRVNIGAYGNTIEAAKTTKPPTKGSKMLLMEQYGGR
ncbi:MAG: right-handed parallel beta-helix repeat-containing protein [Candidatus Omnitrophica bacterium]|nr:right-handed parallel beta-helix repeat-containing protein [Candidatus Omnitrophota bacterium]